MASEGNSYTSSINGITVITNYDPNKPAPPNSQYTVDFKFRFPYINYLGQSLSSLVPQWSQSFASQMFAQGHQVSDLSISAPDNYTLRWKFRASSPPIAIVIAVILGIIAIITWIIYLITATLTSPQATSFLNVSKYALIALATAGFGIGGYFIYKALKE